VTILAAAILAATLTTGAHGGASAPEFVYALTKITFVTQFTAKGPVTVGGKPAKVSLDVRLVFLYSGRAKIHAESGAGVSCSAGLNCRSFKPAMGSSTINGTLRYDDGSPTVACSLKPLLGVARLRSSRVAALQLTFQNQAGTRVTPSFAFGINAETYLGPDTFPGKCAVFADPAIRAFARTQVSGLKPTPATLGPKSVKLVQGADYVTQNATAAVLRGSSRGHWTATLKRVS
jgi:hypothetical protein